MGCGCNNNWCLFIILILLFCNNDCGSSFNNTGCGCGAVRNNDCGCGCGC
ncbi:MAG: hypothetical protein IKU08_02115 [Clostridia bacterium]|nr:hypothetical protein [Clostridia bacterium]